MPWFEAITENFTGIEGGAGGKPIRVLEKIRELYPVALHGVSLSIGSSDPLDKDYLKKIRSLAARIEPQWMSDHLCWTSVEGKHLHDLLPLPFTEKVIQYLVSRILYVQDFLGRKILFENVSSYMTFSNSEMTEWEFLSELSKRADCGILLDINNIYVNSVNHGFDPISYINGVPRDRIGQFHLAGHSNQGRYLLDTHDHPITAPVWNLYEKALRCFGPIPTLIERDENIPAFPELMKEVHKANSIAEKVHGKKRISTSITDRTPTVVAVDHH